MMSSPLLSGSSPGSSGASESTDLFRDLCGRLKDCHDSALQGLQTKVNKLKKERCLDAQRLEEFYSRHQQLREQHKTLRDTVTVLEDRLRAGLCDRCSVTEEHMRKKQVEFEKGRQQNMRLIAEIMTERNSLQDENRKLSLELDRLNGALSVSPEPEEAVIPDSPLQKISLPVVSKMRRRKETHHVRYAEKSLSQSQSSALNEPRKGLPSQTAQSQGNCILVPETCYMDATQTQQCSSQGHEGAVVAETCRLDLPDDPLPIPQRKGPLLGCPGTTTTEDGSLSLLPRLKLIPANAQRRHLEGIARIAPLRATSTPCGASHRELERGKRRKSSEKEEDEEVVDKPLDLSDSPQKALVPPLNAQRGSSVPASENQDRGQKQHILFKHPSTSPSDDRSKNVLLSQQTHDVHHEPIRKRSREDTEKLKQTSVLQANPCARVKRSPPQDNNGTASTTLPSNAPETPLGKAKLMPAEQMWSLDPEAALSQYDVDTPTSAEPPCEGESVDMDCTFVSPSLLHRGAPRTSSVTGIGQRANDSLAEIFDRTGYGDYESCPQHNGSYLDKEEPHHGEEEFDDKEEEKEHKDAHMPQSGTPNGEHKDSKNLSFAHVEVVRKKAERRKLKGHTCKECEIYYADLSEAERVKKLSACSRHRFRYLPPSTPDHFWEVGFPSTQTCVDRGYVKEDNDPEQRLRRRRPYNALPQRQRAEDLNQ
uniref:DNA endonuclease RBBP8 n=1 Tax=Oncorhynchus gorbuscha TaxID=8017 RepID=UPI001EAEA352|nr:DNA endonuclease RBBP8 [Oncorhynchus gorbuscha]XP_046211960.1 DNA endonuclease RBBP8 [Oncorhynchus gorbuscha]XP_046211961.1 DNA endonuclease RBBP8 [Oncorhynchus gorbuscha]XP_046211962.1 DNA endonuclease RBBP8 [Oncorhynchus gorbuscha]XP_046211963.1 DNA endonuclease RBBP8 [Oncorhynchus gorbuscha]